jgi:hypothetical protein
LEGADYPVFGESVQARYPSLRIMSKNSALFLVAFILSSKNFMASM